MTSGMIESPNMRCPGRRRRAPELMRRKLRDLMSSSSLLLLWLATPALADSPVEAAAALVARVLPTMHYHFVLELLPPQPNSAMQLDSTSDKVILRGTGGVEIASALNWYLNEYCNVTFDWNTYAEGQLPSSLPLPLPHKSAIVARRLP